MKKIYVKPRIPGNIVRNFERPDLRPVPDDGEWVTDGPQWRRYLRDEDLILAKPPKEAKKDSETTSKSKGEK